MYGSQVLTHFARSHGGQPLSLSLSLCLYFIVRGVSVELIFFSLFIVGLPPPPYENGSERVWDHVYSSPVLGRASLIGSRTRGISVIT